MLEQEKSHKSDCQNDEERYVKEDMNIGLEEFATIVEEDALEHKSLLVHHQHDNEDNNEQTNYHQNRDFDADLCD